MAPVKEIRLKQRTYPRISSEIIDCIRLKRERERDISWSLVMDCRIVDSAWTNFKNLFSSVLDQVAPVKEIRL